MIFVICSAWNSTDIDVSELIVRRTDGGMWGNFSCIDGLQFRR